jgi:hypothetical protein
MYRVKDVEMLEGKMKENRVQLEDGNVNYGAASEKEHWSESMVPWSDARPWRLK